MPSAAETQARLQSALPVGSTASEVTTYLDREGIEHSGYVERERIINAILRDVEKSLLVSRSIRVDFHFDNAGKLVAIEARDVRTGL